MSFDVSLFERLWRMEKGVGMQHVILDTQYRMHPSICRFSSDEFYQGNLQTGVAEHARPLSPSPFPWPVAGDDVQASDSRRHRMVFIECAVPEEVGLKSICNKAQAALCAKVLLSCREIHPAPFPSLHPGQIL